MGSEQTTPFNLKYLYMSNSKFYLPIDPIFRNESKGIQLTFENNWTISIMFGYGNYGSNYDQTAPHPTGKVSYTAEIAIWNNSNGKWHKFKDGDTVAGYLNTDEVAKWIKFTQSRKATTIN